jgi:hypothetical protein
MIERHIDLSNYPIEQINGERKLKLADQELSLKLYETRKRLAEL